MRWPSYNPTVLTVAPKPFTSKPHTRTRRPVRPSYEDDYILAGRPVRPSHDDDGVFIGNNKAGKNTKGTKSGKGAKGSKAGSKTAKDNKETKSRKEKPSLHSSKGGKNKPFRSIQKWEKTKIHNTKSDEELI